MYCGNCGNRIPDDSSFCPECGTPLEDMHEKKQGETYFKSKKYQYEEDEPEKKSSVLPVLITCVGCLIVVGIIIIGFMILGNTKGDETAQAESASEPQVQVGEEVQAGENDTEAKDPDEVEKTDIVEPEETPESLSPEEIQAAEKAEAQAKAKAEAEAKAKADAQAAAAGEYVIANSSTVTLTQADISSLSADQLRLAINEIYARHGRMFKDQELQAYFNGKSWYQGTIQPDAFQESMLSALERQNIQLISARKDSLTGQAGTSSNSAGAVVGNVSLYPGDYHDIRIYGDNPERVNNYVTVVISNVTSTGFDFKITRYNTQTNNYDVIFRSHTAVFTGNGTTATYYGQQYTLNFSFPRITELTVTGFSDAEGITFANNGIPGHEFS
ncbi:MAG: YARHG domain-containing protein [Lachnospiraceae bacterium]|nr:YARHG domain-containing protein [Lachnospiraceae bacterium]MDD3615422.1 YARHG domain-containing protein [Lachnospiraceae bacterium]